MSDKVKIVLCPYCGHVQDESERCDDCGGYFEPLSRRATQIAMGPWYIRDKEHPFRPGCSYDIMVKLAKAGRIKPTTVMRGPSTKQFWSVARNVPGIAHLLGYCHACNERCEPADKRCSTCKEPFPSPDERNELGLAYPTHEDARQAQRVLDYEMKLKFGEAADKEDSEAAGEGRSQLESVSAKPAAMRSSGGEDLLSKVLGPIHLPGEKETPSSVSQPRSLPPPSPVNAAGTAVLSEPRAKLDVPPPAAPQNAVLEQMNEQSQKLGVMTWLLVGFNVVALIVVVVLFIIFSGQPAQDTTGKGNSPDGGTSVPATQHRQPGDKPEPQDIKPINPANPELPPAKGPNRVFGDAGTSPRVSETAAPATTPVSKPAASAVTASLPAPPPALTASPAVLAKWDKRFDEALAFEDKGKLSEAMEVFNEIGADIPDRARHEKLKQAMKRVGEKMSKGVEFFKIQG